MNVFITGINQIEDVEIDRLNKPWLPIAAGDLSLEAARRIVAVAAIAPLLMAVTQGVEELVAVGVALAIGWAYSCPPLRLKRYPALAAGSITFVRSLVVNLGVWLHIAGTPVSAGVWALIAVTVPFSFAIAVLKDVPDIEGDRRFGIATFSVRLGPRPVLAVGVGALTLGGLGMAVAGPLLLDGANAAVLVAGHLLGVAALWRWALRVDPADPVAFAAFYQRVWQLFFCEYLLVPARLPRRLTCASSSTRPRRAGSTGWSRSATTAGSTRCSGRRRCATGRWRSRAWTIAALEVVDVGAGTGFATEAIVRTVAPDRVTMLDQSPHQLARARRKPALAGVTQLLGDAEALPFATDSRDRYVSTGSIEYWPDPQRAIAEAYRVLRPGGVALLAGPLRRTHPLARALSDAWMLFPGEDEYVAWFERAGFEAIERVHVAPDWWDPRWDPYAVAIAGVKPRAGEPPALPPAPRARRRRRPRRPPRAWRASPSARSRGARSSPVALWFRATRGRAGRRRSRSATRP